MTPRQARMWLEEKNLLDPDITSIELHNQFVYEQRVRENGDAAINRFRQRIADEKELVRLSTPVREPNGRVHLPKDAERF